MEIMYSNKNYKLINKGSRTAIYGDKIDLVRNGIDFDGISYDDEWTVKRFLNGYKFKIDDIILDLFSELEVSYSLLKRRIKTLSKGQLKIILFMYVILARKKVIVLDYFDKGLSYKYKKRIVNYLKSKYDGTLIVISNDLVFLNMLCNHLIVYINGEEVFNNDFDLIYKSKIKIEYPEIIKFINLAKKSKAKLSYTVDNKELLKDIYRSIG